MDASCLNSEFEMVINNLILQLLTQKLSASSKSESADTSTSSDWSYEGSTGSSSFQSAIEEACKKYDVSTKLVNAVIKAESNYRPGAVSSAGAMGLMQLMPGTAKSLGVEDPMDPEENIDGGTKLLSKLLDRYDGDVKLALAAYNAGPGAVDKYDGIPPYQETQTYVKRIMEYMQSMNSWSG